MSSVVRPPISGKLLRTFFPLCHFHYSQRLLSIWCVGCQAAVWITSVSNNLLRVAKNDAKESDISRMAVKPWKYLHPHTPLTTHTSLSLPFSPPKFNYGVGQWWNESCGLSSHSPFTVCGGLTSGLDEDQDRTGRAFLGLRPLAFFLCACTCHSLHQMPLFFIFSLFSHRWA